MTASQDDVSADNGQGPRGALERIALSLGTFAATRSKAVLGGILLFTLGLAPFLAAVEYDDDILKFLPENSPEVQRFQDIGDRFQGLSIALLGIEVEEGDLFEVEKMSALRALTEELRGVEGVAFASSITEVQDVAVQVDEFTGEEVTVVSDLVGELPGSAEEEGAVDAMAALRAKVLSRNHIRGALISEAGDAALVLCYLKAGTSLKDAADGIRIRTEEMLNELGQPFKVHYGGSPFVGSYIVHTTRRDIVRLSLLSGFAIIMILLLTARSFAGALIALMSVGIGIVWVVGLMGLLGQPLTLVSSSLPMLLLALGSAYSIHILVRVFNHLDEGAETAVDAVTGAIREVGPPIFIAGLTSAFAFLSFLAMDIGPMRDFGAWMFVGTLVIVLLAVLVVPAACAAFQLGVREGGRTPVWALTLMTGNARAVMRRPLISALALGGIVVLALSFMGEGKRNMTMRDFFAEGSEPVMAEDFLETHLGGSVFMQIQVKGDIKNPLVLRQMDRIAALAGRQPGVSTVQSIVEPMVLASEALYGRSQIPEGIQMTRAMSALMEGDPNLRVIVDPEWKHGLIHAKVRGAYTAEALGMVELLEGPAGAGLRGERAGVRRSAMNEEMLAFELGEVKAHLRNIYARGGAGEVDDEALHVALTRAAPTPEAEVLKALVGTELKRALIDDELIYLAEGMELETVVNAVTMLMREAEEGLTLEGLYPVLFEVASEEDQGDEEGLIGSVEYLVEVLQGQLLKASSSFRQRELAKLLPEANRGVFSKELGRAAGALDSVYGSLPVSMVKDVDEEDIVGKASVAFEVTGSPVVYEGMNISVERNQQRCLLISSLLVFLALAWFFKSPILALVASVPAAFTLLVTFGLMGYWEIPMDVGTSMMTSIAIGIGIDYAVHFLWHHGVPSRADADDVMVESMGATGWGIVINALEVAAGFAILAMGTIVPMRNVGVLTASAMVVSAAATLILVPALVRWATPFLSRRSRTI
ncbi:MAG: MMPL family transporter [Myxococcota bacterium]|nr:MMPL family transporter [Myxococcota bacterium]